MMELQLAKMDDLGIINKMFKEAIQNMIKENIFQWDEIYPNEVDLKNDILQKHMYKIIWDKNIIAAFTLNKEYDTEYLQGEWEYSGNKFMVLHRLCVNVKYQNKGYGKEIMMIVEKYLKDKGIKSIRMDTFSENPYALKLYDKLGYKKVGEINWRKGLFLLFEKIL